MIVVRGVLGDSIAEQLVEQGELADGLGAGRDRIRVFVLGWKVKRTGS